MPVSYSTHELFIESIMSRISFEPFSGCWIWMGCTDTMGYGQVRRNNKNNQVHTVTYQNFIGLIPDGLELDHLCRIRCCCNPHHLEPVTHRENVRRGMSGKATGARKRARTHCRHGHEYTPENTNNKSGYRICLACLQPMIPIYQRRQYLKRKAKVALLGLVG